ncbi:MAG: hypothetical protein IKU52_07445 [Clostridia bacterium]|nr:hypothetical protein [Clostridia bacterium]
MVKKLLKHELKYYIRIFIPIFAALVLFSGIGRIVQLFEPLFNDKTIPVYYILLIGTILIVVITMITALILQFIFSIVRFYKHLFSGEGYLSFTIPVSVDQHLFVKLFSSILIGFFTLLAIIASICILTSGDLLVELIKAARYLIKDIIKEGSELVFVIIGIYALYFLVSYLYSTLLCYLCIALGQLFNKARIAMAVVFYFAHYIIMQVGGMALSILISFGMIGLSASSDISNMERYAGVFESNPDLVTVIAFLVPLLIYIALSVVYYFAVRYILKNRLNLE